MRKRRGNRRNRPAGSTEEPQPTSSTSAVAGQVESIYTGNAAAGSPAGRQSRSRGRGHRRKQGAPPPPAPTSPVQPLIPAYSQSDGPRAPLTLVPPGAPTGEAEELESDSAHLEPKPAQPQPAVAHAPKGAVILSVGLPGSGKTTWFKRKGVTPLSSDLVRQLLFDNTAEQGHQDLVFSSLRSLLRARLIARMPMNYVDATNLSPKERRHWIRMAKDFGYEAQAVYFDVPLQTCLERNRRRARVVPEDVMQRMSAKLRPPTFDEGFTKIVVVRVKHHPSEAQTGAGPAAEPATGSAGVAPETAAPETAAPLQAESGEMEPLRSGFDGGELEPQE